ncbi:hypothetical protein KRR23_20285 [Pseudomonas sp. CVAP|uniref:hypothetical protein n=1 Tax=Pseudomonas sp. CVAP\|nr:hypothetical protein [Pseudomonas sp. CVAP\
MGFTNKSGSFPLCSILFTNVKEYITLSKKQSGNTVIPGDTVKPGGARGPAPENIQADSPGDTVKPGGARGRAPVNIQADSPGDTVKPGGARGPASVNIQVEK